MRTLLLTSLVVSPLALAAPADLVTSQLSAQVLKQAPTSPASKDDEDEGDDTPSPAPSTPPASPTGEKSSAETGGVAPDAAAVPAPAQSAATKDARAQELVSGAPLYNPNVAVHIVQKKQFADNGKHEIALYPFAPQVNGKFAQHMGTALSYTYHLNENFGLQLTPQYNWFNQEAGFNLELVEKVGQVPQAATSLLLQWSMLGGVEVTPVYGKFAFYEGSLAHFSFVINGGAGVGSTRTQIKQLTRQANGDEFPATYGDTGLRFMGSVGAGFRVQVGNRFALRLELRDQVYTARVDTVNGCNAQDLDVLDNTADNIPLSQVQVSGSCQAEKFDGVDGHSYPRRRDIPLAKALVETPSSDVLNNVGFYSGFAFLF